MSARSKLFYLAGVIAVAAGSIAAGVLPSQRCVAPPLSPLPIGVHRLTFEVCDSRLRLRILLTVAGLVFGVVLFLFGRRTPRCRIIVGVVLGLSVLLSLIGAALMLPDGGLAPCPGSSLIRGEVVLCRDHRIPTRVALAGSGIGLGLLIFSFGVSDRDHESKRRQARRLTPSSRTP